MEGEERGRERKGEKKESEESKGFLTLGFLVVVLVDVGIGLAVLVGLVGLPGVGCVCALTRMIRRSGDGVVGQR